MARKKESSRGLPCRQKLGRGEDWQGSGNDRLLKKRGVRREGSVQHVSLRRGPGGTFLHKKSRRESAVIVMQKKEHHKPGPLQRVGHQKKKLCVAFMMFIKKA